MWDEENCLHSWKMKKKILSSHHKTLLKFMYSSNLFALWQRPKTHKEYFSALKLFFLQVIACFWILLNWTFFLFKSYLYKQDNIVSVENSFRIVWILCFYFVLGYFFNLKNVVIYVWMSMRTLGVFFYGQLKWKDIERLFSSLCFYFICLSCCVLYLISHIWTKYSLYEIRHFLGPLKFSKFRFSIIWILSSIFSSFLINFFL